MEALEALVAACEDSFGADDETFSDDEDVMEPAVGITYGTIRNARIALTAMTA